MSLTTLLEIGHKLRTELPITESLKYHNFIRAVPKNEKKKTFSYYQIDVDEQFQILLDSLRLLEGDVPLLYNLFFLKYKATEADTYVKYIFGDICSDYFVLKDDPNKNNLYAKNSFLRGDEEAKRLGNQKILDFRASLSKILPSLKVLLEKNKDFYINFSFQGNNWYELEEIFEDINSFMLSNFLKNENGNLSLNSFLTRTIKDAPEILPNFNSSNTYKVFSFENIDQMKDLIHSGRIQQSCKFSLDDIMINILPKGNLSAKSIIDFYSRNTQLDFANQTPEDIDPFLIPLSYNIDGLEKYDIIFSRKSKPIGMDILEISDISNNLLKHVIRKDQTIKKELKTNITIAWAIKEIFGEKKYTNHLLQILPQIYKDTYNRDDHLLPAFLGRVELHYRNDEKFSFEHYRLFLLYLSKHQNNNRMAEIVKTKSFALGLELGKMAEPFAAWRKKKCPIRSFEKNYVGTINRRINSLDKLAELCNDINRKLLLHDLNTYGMKDSYQSIIDMLSNIDENEYNRHQCELGFFYGYNRLYKEEVSEQEEEEEVTNEINI